MNFERLRSKITLCLLATVPLSLASFTCRQNTKKDEGNVNNVASGTSEKDIPVLNPQNQFGIEPINFDLTKENFAISPNEPLSNSRVIEILEEAKKFDIDITSLQAFTDVYLKVDFTNQLYKLLDSDYKMSTDFLLSGLKYFLIKNFKNAATSQESREIIFDDQLSQENLIVATGLILQTFREPLIREAGFFNDYLDYQNPEKRTEVTVLDSYDDDNYQELLNDRGYNIYKYQEFSQTLISSIREEVSAIDSKAKLRDSIVNLIENVPELKHDFERLASQFRKDQIIDRMLTVVYDAYSSNFSFEKPKVSVPLTAIGLAYFNALEANSNTNLNDRSYWLAVNQYGQSYKMHSFLLSLLESNAEQIYESSKEGRDLIERLPELHITNSFMRYRYSFNFLNLPNLQNRSDIVASGAYPVSKLSEQCYNIINLENYLTDYVSGLNLGEIFSSEFFNQLKLLSTDNASELFYFTLDDVLSKNNLNHIPYSEASSLYLLCQIVASKNSSFFSGEISTPIKNNREVDLGAIISSTSMQGQSSFIDTDETENQLELQVPVRYLY